MISAPDNELGSVAAGHRRTERSGAATGTTATEDGYPRQARRFDVERSVRVEFRVDAQGRVLASRIVERRLRARDRQGSRPLAFETLLDEASLERVARPLLLARRVPLPTPSSSPRR